MTRDLVRMRWLSWLMGIVLLVSVVYACSGCAYMTANRHTKVLILNQDVAEQIGKLSYRMYKDGILSESDNAKMRDLYNTFKSFNRTYAMAILEYEAHKNDEFLMKLNSAKAFMNDAYIELLKVAEILIGWKGDNQ